MKSLFDTPAVKTVKTLRLIRLTLRNFKRFKEFVLEPDGQSLKVYGDNATGKTTLMDACMWLLFDKDSLNNKTFEIKRLNENNEPVHYLDHEVEGEFFLDGKGPFTLKKVYKEKWTKKRGSATEEFTGHTTDYFVNDVPKRKGDYEKFVSDIIEEDMFRLLSDPRHFNEGLHWTKRRELIMEICEAISDQKIIANHPEYTDLETILSTRTLEEHLSVLKAQKAKINKRLKEIPIRIDESTRKLPRNSAKMEDVETSLGKARTSLAEVQAQIVRAKQGHGLAEKEAELIKINSQLIDMESAARRKLDDLRIEKMRTIQQAEFEMKQAQTTAKTMSQNAQNKRAEVGALEAILDSLRKAWVEIDDETFECSLEDVCPTCGQDLPAHQIEEARQKAEETFNISKAKRLEANETEGKEAVTKKNLFEKEAETYEREAAAYETKAKQQEGLIERTQKELAKLSDTTAVTSKEYNALIARRQILELEMEAAQEQVDTTALDDEALTLQVEIKALEEARALIKVGESSRQRIAELTAEQQKLSAELGEVERAQNRFEEFQRIKIRDIEDKVARHFNMVRFKLFHIQVNGATEEVCETLVDGVPYATGLNNGGKIQAGIDIINTLQKHYGLVVPVWLDNREAVTWIPETQAQVISLIVSPEDKELRVEMEE